MLLIKQTIVGFGDIDKTGYLDRLFIYIHASITAKPLLKSVDIKL